MNDQKIIVCFTYISLICFSLHPRRLSQFLQLKEEQLSEDRRVKQIMYEALQLRFSLVGGMFDIIQRSANSIQEWSHTFTLLICYR